MGGVGTFGVVACGQEVAVTPDELVADADFLHYTLGASEKDGEEAIRKAVDRRSYSAIGREQQRREDAKKELTNGKLGGGFGFTCQVKVSDFGEMASIALFSASASSCLRCSTAAST